MKHVIKNQFSEPILKIFEEIRELNFKPVYLIPSTVKFLALLLVLIIFVLLYPYCLVPIIATFI